MTASVSLNVAMNTYGHTRSLVDGSVAPNGIQLRFAEVSSLRTAMTQMARTQAFDVCEMSPTSYLIAKSRGTPLIALPVPLFSQFPFGQLVVKAHSAIREVADLAGKTIGANTWAQPTSVWLRGILDADYALNLERLSWLLVADDPVAELRVPRNVRRAKGASLAEMLASGEIDAAVMNADADRETATRLFTDPVKRAKEWFKRTGALPIHHLLVLRHSLITDHAWVADELFDAFVRAKHAYLDRLERDGPQSAGDRGVLEVRDITGGDPLPYGVEANRRTMDTLMRFMVDQQLLPAILDTHSVFVSLRSAGIVA